LEALAAAPDGQGEGIVEGAFLVGAPIVATQQQWKRARAVVRARQA
jgi:hypothetical protein